MAEAVLSDYAAATARVTERVEAIASGTGRGTVMVDGEGLMMVAGFDIPAEELRREVENNVTAGLQRFVLLSRQMSREEAFAGLLAGAYLHGLAHGLNVGQIRQEKGA